MIKLIKYYMAFFVLCALACENKKNVDPVKTSVDSIISLSSWTYINDKDKEKSVQKLEQILRNNPQLDASSRFKIYGNLCSYYYLHKKNMAKALNYADSMIWVIEKSDNYENYIRELALGYYSKGDVLFAMGRYDDSYKNYYRAKQILSLKKDNCTSSDYSYRMGMVLYKQAKYADAAYFFNQGFEESESCVQDFFQIYRRQELLNNIALCYARQNQTDSALLAYNKALAYINKNDTLAEKKKLFAVARGVIYGNIGGEYFRQGNYKKAEELLKKSLAINGRAGFENPDGALTKIKLTKLYLKNNRLQEAKKLLYQLQSCLHRLNVEEVTREYYHLHSQYLDRIGAKAQAFVQLSRYVAMTDSVQEELDKLKATDISERFRNLDNQSEISYLKREKQLQGIYLYVTVVFSVMAIVIIILIISYWKKSRNSVSELTALNNEVVRQKQKLEEALIELKVSNATKDNILRAVAHDLRNPIAGIAALIELIMLDEKEGADQEKHLLIKETCTNALVLINELIEAAEIQSNKQVIDKRGQTNLVELIANAIELLQFKANEKQQLIHFQTAVKEIFLNIDQKKMVRVVNNLISNAIKFSYDKTNIVVEVQLLETAVIVSVKDHGLGIAENLKDEVFQLFTSAKRKGTNGEKSYGLGLSIAKQLIQAHEGKIWFESNADGGTTFYFSLPKS